MRKAVCQLREYLLLSLAQWRAWQHLLRLCQIDEWAPRAHRTNREEELSVCRLFRDVPHRPGAEHRASVGGIIVHREHENLRFRAVPADFPQRLETGEARHGEIEDDDIGLECARLLDRLDSIGRLCHDSKIGLRL